MISLMAKLEKADQAFCFTSGMAALAAITHLLEAGTFFFFIREFKVKTFRNLNKNFIIVVIRAFKSSHVIYSFVLF